MKNRVKNMALARHKADHDTVSWEALLLVCGNKCVRCGASHPARDHIVPVSMGGSNGIENIQPLCWPCNRSKRLGTTDYRNPCWSYNHSVVLGALEVAHHLDFAHYFAPSSCSLKWYSEDLMSAIKSSVTTGGFIDPDLIRQKRKKARAAAQRAMRSMKEYADMVGDL